MFITPTVVGELLYLGSCSGVFYAFERDTGAIRWAHDTANDGPPANFHGDPLVTGETIIVGSDGGDLGYLYALELKTGNVRWQRPYGRGVATNLYRRGDALYALTMAGELLCLDVASGEERFLIPAPGPESARLKSSLLLHGERVFYTVGERLLAVDASEGKAVWDLDLGDPANTSLARIGDSLYVGTLPGGVLRIDAKTGKILAVFEAGGMPFGTPRVDGGSLLLLIDPDRLVSLSPDLELQWIGMTDLPISSFRPLLRDGLVLVGDEGGVLHGIDLQDGSVRWRLPFEGALRGLGGAGDILYIGTLPGKIFAYRL